MSNPAAQEPPIIIRSAEFVKSSTSPEQCPPPDKPEFAFIGRSNVGKSSLINVLTNNNKLAHTSSKPGKTQTINHYLVNDEWYLTDLPGYGYAKTSKINRAKWADFISAYLRERPNLFNVFQLVDAAIPPQTLDGDFTEWLGDNGVPFTIVFTKTDKRKQRETDRNINAHKQLLAESWTELPVMLRSSALKGQGTDRLLAYIKQLMEQYEPAFRASLEQGGK